MGLELLRVLEHYDLLYNAVPSSGEQVIKIICPLHNESVPSMSVDLERGYFYCFGCGAKGSIVELISKLDGIDTLKAMQRLCKITGGKVFKNGESREEEEKRETKDRKKLLKDAHDFFYSLPKPSWNVITSHYMFDRGFTPKTLRHFDVRINQSSSYPVIIPYLEQGVFKGYVCRRVDSEEPKYLYNRGFTRRSTVAGYLEKGPVLIVEGIMDLMRAWQNGFKNACATLGWKCTSYQAKKISTYATVVISGLDNDDAGERGYQEHLKLFDGVPVYKFPFPKGFNGDIGDMDKRTFRKQVEKCLNKK